MLVVMALALMPAEVPMPSSGWDKSNHLLAFFVMTLLGGVAYPGQMALVLAGLLAYGALIEVLQAFTSSTLKNLIELTKTGARRGKEVSQIARKAFRWGQNLAK